MDPIVMLGGNGPGACLGFHGEQILTIILCGRSPVLTYFIMKRLEHPYF